MVESVARCVNQNIDKPRILQAALLIELPPRGRQKLQSLHGTENLLDGLPGTRPARGFPAAHLVGLGRDHSYRLRRVVGRLPQRLVLKCAARTTFQEAVLSVIVKVPLAATHGVPLAGTSTQPPVIVAPVFRV